MDTSWSENIVKFHFHYHIIFNSMESFQVEPVNRFWFPIRSHLPAQYNGQCWAVRRVFVCYIYMSLLLLHVHVFVLYQKPLTTFEIKIYLNSRHRRTKHMKQNWNNHAHEPHTDWMHWQEGKCKLNKLWKRVWFQNIINKQTNEQKMLNVLRIKHKLRNKQHTHKKTTRICSLGRDLKECVIVNEENQKKKKHYRTSKRTQR